MGYARAFRKLTQQSSRKVAALPVRYNQTQLAQLDPDPALESAKKNDGGPQDLEDLRIVATMPNAPLPPWLHAVVAAAIAALSLGAWRRLRGTTLAAPALWATGAAAAIAAVEIALAGRAITDQSLTSSLWRYAAAVGVFCPLMAVLGAKRPQDRGWQWVVFSLWGVLLVPAFQALAGASGKQLELFAAWRWMIVALICMGLLNYLPTRFAMAAILVAAGQFALLSDYLFPIAADSARMAGLMALLAAAAVIDFQSRRHPPPTVRTPLARMTERWLAFRDGWGAFWALRVMQRVNQSAEQGQWPVRLEWRGLVGADTVDDATAATMQQAFDSLLRRFERVND